MRGAGSHLEEKQPSQNIHKPLGRQIFEQLHHHDLAPDHRLERQATAGLQQGSPGSAPTRLRRRLGC